MADRLELQFLLSCKRDHAFRTFTEKVDLWWPKGHRRSPDAKLQFEPGQNGRLLERSGDGEKAIGDIVAWEPPGRLAFNWWLGAERLPTHVIIQFEDVPTGTEVKIRHTPGAAASDDIWPSRVGRFETGWTNTMTALGEYIAAGKDS